MASSKGSERSRVTAFTLREMEKTLEGLEQRRDVIRLCFNKLALIAGADNTPQRGQGKTQSRQWLGPGGAGQAARSRRISGPVFALGCVRRLSLAALSSGG